MGIVRKQKLLTVTSPSSLPLHPPLLDEDENTDKDEEEDVNKSLQISPIKLAKSN